MLFVFISLAYVVAWVVPDKTFGHDPGYGGFLSNLAHGSLGRLAPVQGAGVSSRPSVDSIVWGASKVTLSPGDERTLTYSQPSIPLVSNVSGALAGGEVATPEYWVSHVRAAVRATGGPEGGRTRRGGRAGQASDLCRVEGRS